MIYRHAKLLHFVGTIEFKAPKTDSYEYITIALFAQQTCDREQYGRSIIVVNVSQHYIDNDVLSFIYLR